MEVRGQIRVASSDGNTFERMCGIHIKTAWPNEPFGRRKPPRKVSSFNENHSMPPQAVLTLAVIAKNRAPRAITGTPPAFVMAGRCDVSSGSSTCMWGHDPVSHDSLIPQLNSLLGILEARNAAIQAASTHAIKACLDHNLLDRGQEQFPIGSSVQIAVGQQWVGAFRVFDHSAGNLLIERGNKIPKWPKCKTRLVNLENRDEMGRIPTPVNARVWNKRRRWMADEYPEGYRPGKANLPGREIAIPDTADIRDSSLPEEALVDIGQRTADAPEQGGNSMEIGVIFDGQTARTRRP